MVALKTICAWFQITVVLQLYFFKCKKLKLSWKFQRTSTFLEVQIWAVSWNFILFHYILLVCFSASAFVLSVISFPKTYFFKFVFSVVPLHLLFYPTFSYLWGKIHGFSSRSLELCSESTQHFCKAELSVKDWVSVQCRSDLVFFNLSKFSQKSMKIGLNNNETRKNFDFLA